jgi:hypothetical protein
MKKILLIGPEFFGYTDRIFNKIGENHNVLLEYTFTPNTLVKRFYKKNSLINYYQTKKIHKNQDCIFVINGKDVPTSYISELRKNNKNACFILYIWDDYKNINHSEEFLNLFDRVYTYSKYDSIDYPNLIYQPFFYSFENNKCLKYKNINLSFVGSLHSDRFNVYDNINQIVEGSNYLYLYSDGIDFLKKFKNWKYFKYVNFKQLSYENYVNILSKSKMTLEIPHLNQRNITTRAIEALGTRTKLITRSKAVLVSDFYKPNNIFILNSNNISEIKKWSQLPYEEIDFDIKKKYTIDSWCKSVLKL